MVEIVVPVKHREKEGGSMTNDRPTVSVLVITYNHEKYISQALDSILMQKTGFYFDIVIGVDRSKDGTADIVKRYENDHPEKIRATYHETNIGMMPNLIETLRRCTGTYIALLEGDDYWTDPLKLQKQVDLMEAHPEVYICGHQTDFLHADQGEFLEKRPVTFNGIKFLSFNEVVAGGNVFHTSAFVFRNHDKENMLSYLGSFNSGDLPILLYYAHLGITAVSSETMSIYRRTGEGASSTPENPDGGIMKLVTYRNFLSLHPSYHQLLLPRISNYLIMLASSRLRYGDDLPGSVRHLQEAIKSDPTTLSRNWKTIIALTIRMLLYPFYKGKGVKR